MGDKTLIGKFLVWRARNINDRYFIIILSALIGFLAGMAAYLLKTSVFYIHDTLTEWFTKSEQNYLFVIYPGIGILLTVVFLKYIVRDETRHGIPRILYVISKLGGKMKQHKVFSSLVGSSLTAGFGGSIGLEAPIISTGSSMGSNIGSFLRLNYKTTTLLIGCGAAGAMASIFTTPIAAVVFSLEVLMLDKRLAAAVFLSLGLHAVLLAVIGIGLGRKPFESDLNNNSPAAVVTSLRLVAPSPERKFLSGEAGEAAVTEELPVSVPISDAEEVFTKYISNLVDLPAEAYT